MTWALRARSLEVPSRSPLQPATSSPEVVARLVCLGLPIQACELRIAFVVVHRSRQVTFHIPWQAAYFNLHEVRSRSVSAKLLV